MDLLHHFSTDTGFLAIVENMGKKAASTGRRSAALGHFEAGGTMDLYHHTSPEEASSIVQSGRFEAHGDRGDGDPDDFDPRVYFSDRPHGGQAARDHGPAAVHVRFPVGYADHEGEGDPGENWYSIPAEHLRSRHIVGLVPHEAATRPTRDRHRADVLEHFGAAAPVGRMTVDDVGKLKSEYGLDEHGRQITMADVARKTPDQMASDRYEPHELEAMVDDVRHNGVREPIEVSRGGVTDGTHRYWAAAQAGLPHIPVRHTSARPGRGQEACSCCDGQGEHTDGSSCHRCGSSGYTSRGDREPNCPGQVQPRRRHWRESGKNGDLPELEYKAATPDRNDPHFHELSAVHPDKGQVAFITWHDEEHPKRPRTVHAVWTDEGWQRRGIATELFRRANGMTPGLRHSDDLNKHSKPWVKSLTSAAANPTGQSPAQDAPLAGGGPKTAGGMPENYGGTHCVVCHEQVRVNLRKQHINDGWHHADSAKRDHPATPADPQGVLDSVPAQRAKRDQVYSEVGEELGRHPRMPEGMPPDPFTASLHAQSASGAPLEATGHEGAQRTHREAAVDEPEGIRHVLPEEYELKATGKPPWRTAALPAEHEAGEQPAVVAHFEYPLAPGHLGEQGCRVHDENRGFYAERQNWSGHQPQQTWGTLHLHHPDGTAVAHLDYAQVGRDSDPYHEAHVEDLRTGEGHTGRGYASALMDHLYAQHPEPASIHHSLRTDEGGGWWDRYVSTRPHIAEREHRQRAAEAGDEEEPGLPEKEAVSREDQLAAMASHDRASALAQEHVRYWHPRVALPLGDHPSGRIHPTLVRWLSEGGHPRADEAYVARHPRPERRASNSGRGPGGEPAVALHPDRWDYGTLAHEAAHLIRDHEAGRQPGDPPADPEGVHSPQWAAHYSRMLNDLEPGSGDDFLSERGNHLPGTAGPAAVVKHFAAVASWSPESDEDARGLLEDMPGFLRSVAGGLDTLTGRLRETPAATPLTDGLAQMASTCRAAAEDAGGILAHFTAATEGAWERAQEPAGS